MKNNRLSDDFINLNAQLMLATERSEILRLAAEFNATIGKLIEKEKSGSYKAYEPQTKSVSMTLKFTTKEISSVNMAKTFKKEFIANGLVAHVIKRESGKNSYCYEIRYRSNGYKIEASSTDLTEAKRKFLAKTTPSEIEKYKTQKSNHRNQWENLNSFSAFYFENFRKPKVSELTYKNDCLRYRNHIHPTLGYKPINKITPADCQELINDLFQAGKGKTANEVFSLLSVIFKAAIAHHLIQNNPMTIVTKERYEVKHGHALTKEEEQKLLNAYIGTPYGVFFAVALYTGLRPNEYQTARIEDRFIIAANSKRKNKKIEYKRIPITKMLAPYLVGINQLNYPAQNIMRERMKDVLPHHILYDLRTTFYTRCKECGVADAARDEFVGHSLGALGNAYTDLSDEYLLKEGLKLNNW